MCGILDPLGDPVGGEGDEDEQTNNLARATASRALTARRVVPWFIFDIDRYHGHREPRAEGCCCQTAEERDEVDVTVGLGDIDCSLQHQNRERDPWNPGDEADDSEDSEDQEYNAAAPVLPRKHVDGRDEAGDDVKDSSDPDELLGELYSIVSAHMSSEVSPREMVDTYCAPTKHIHSLTPKQPPNRT